MASTQRELIQAIGDWGFEELRWRLIRIALMMLIVMVGGTVGYKLIGGPDASWLDCLYMTVITVLTVGYAEVVPGVETPIGRIFTIVLIVGGVAVLGYGLSTVTAVIVEGELLDILERRRMDREIARLNNHYIVCGAGRTGEHIIDELVKTQRPTVVVDVDEERLRYINEIYKVPYVVGDATDEGVLIRAGIERARGLLTALSTDPDNLYVVITARGLNPDIRIVSRAVEPAAYEKLKRAGADAVVDPNHIGGLRMASEMIRPTVVSFLDVMLRDLEETYRIEEVTVQPGSEIAGKRLSDLRLPERTGALVLACKRGDADFQYQPPADTMVEPGTTLVVLGSVESMKKLREMAGIDYA